MAQLRADVTADSDGYESARLIGRDWMRPRSHDGIGARCFVEGKDLAAEMVNAGHALDWSKFSGGYYGR